MDRQILYVHAHEIKDVCKIGIGTIGRAKVAYKYQNTAEGSKTNKLAVFSFENTDAITIEGICKQVLRRINKTEFYDIEFYKACILFTLLGGKLDKSQSSACIDHTKISVKMASPSVKSSIPLSKRFAELIKSLIDKCDELTITDIKNQLNNNGKRNVLLTKVEYDDYNIGGTRTGWKAYNEWWYRTGIDATSLSEYIKKIEMGINK